MERGAVTLDGDAIESQYRDGVPLRQLAEQYSVSKETIRQLLLARGVPLRGRGGNTGNHSRHRL